MRKLFHTLFTLTLVLFFFQAKAQITIGTVDPGPYGVGGSITVPLTFTNNLSGLPVGNVFNLYISDANGVFTGNGTLIGSFNGFYTPGINGIIPNLPIGDGYKLRIRTSNPANNPAAAFIDVPTTIKIRPTASVPVTLTQSGNTLGGDNLGFCPADAGNNKSVLLTDNTVLPTVVEVIVKNLATNVSTSYLETPLGFDITNLAIGYYSVTAIASTTVNGEVIKSIKTYILHNTLLAVNIQDNGINIGCLEATGGTASISYEVTVAGGIGNNYPGTIYRVNWGDGSPTDELTISQIINNSNRISHNFTQTSCGQPTIIGGDGPITNSFKATITSVSNICGVTKSTTAYAQIFLNPVAKVTGPAIGCLNIPMTFTNATIGGTRSDCSTQMKNTWYVDGVKVREDFTNNPLVWTFTVAGNHVVKLVSSNEVGACLPSEFPFPVCIQIPPTASFTLPGAAPVTICANTTLTPTNTSFIDNTCTPNRPFRWIVDLVTAGAQPTFAGGTSFNSENPQFIFSTPGVYDISLSIVNPTCGTVVSPKQRVVVNTTPTATLSPNISLCSPGSYVFSNVNPASPTYTTVSGTFSDLPGTYTWSITGGAYTITNNDLHTKYPTITFSDFATYTITLIHTNNCGTSTVATQVITFIPSPTIDLGPDQNICFINNVSLNAVVTGAYSTSLWTSNGTGTFSTPVNSLTTTYTPSAQDKTRGNVVLTLTLTTALAAPCNTVSKTINITIKPEIKITSAPAINSCTGSALSYQLTANLNPTTYTWTATGSPNAAGFANGSGTIITDVLTNTDPINNATVTYIITPTYDGCPGAPFTLTVNVAPRPVISTTLTDKTICSNNSAAVIATSNIPTAFVATSVATTGITGNTPTLIFGPSSSFTIPDVLINNTTAQGTVTYTITSTTPAGCPGNSVTVVVHVDPAVTVANAGPDESICNTTSYTLNGNHATVGTGTWTFIPSAGQTGVVVTPTTPENATVSGLQGGQSYTFRWTITAPGTCAPTTDDVVITVNTPTIPGTTGTTDPTLVCAAANTGTITLTGNNGSVLKWQSSIDGGTTWVDIANTTNSLTYTNITVSTQYRAVVKNGGCTTEFSTATAITVTPATTIAQAGPDQQLCATTTVTLAGGPALQTGETGIWTRTAGPATVNISTPTDPNTTVTGLVPGQNYTFTWTITGNSPCGPTHDDVVITDYLPLTNSISSTSTEVCYNQVIAITGSTPTGGNGTYSYVWEVSTDGGTNWNVIPGQTGKDLSYQLQTTSSFRRTVTSTICPLVSNIIAVIAQQPITNNTIAAGQSICTGEVPVALTGNTPAGSDGNFNYQWQFSVDNGTTWTNVNGAVALNYAPLALTTTTMYRRLVSTVACNGALQSISNAITIIVRPNAKAEYTFTTDKGCTPFVIDASIITAVAYPDRNATYSWYADNVLIGTGVTFPGYTIATTDQSVTIKLVTAPSQGCQPDEFSHVFSTNQSVAASYTQSATQGCGPLIVNFVNTSTSLTNATFTWDFGNGVTSSQTMPAPVTFQPDPTGKDITYTVTMTATTTCGSTTTTSTVFVKAKPRSVFSPSKTVGCSPMLVTFSNTSPGETNTYSYDFGDGSPLVTTTDKSSVQHTYLTNVVKDFVVTMTAQNECGSDQSSYTIRVSPNTVTAELVVNADQKVGCAPFTVTFYNNSKGASSFIYDFGDGSTLVTRSAPEVVTHTFTTAGTFNVTLTASNGCSEISTSESITVLPQPLAQFNANNTLGCPGLVVQFNNTSTGGISYLWDFGDGTTSQETAPQHVYAGTQEFYTVSLTATNSLGCTYTTTLNQYIHIVQPPVAQFNVLPSTLISIPNYTFKFEDESTNTPTIWLWDFGDKTTSVLKNPSHTYQDVGTYTVTLKVTNQQGCFTTTFKEVTIAGVPGYLYVPNSFMPGSATSELRVFGAKGSGIKDWTMSIFNKWGQQLWQTTKLDEGRPVESWDGTFNSVPVPQGVYFWKIDVEFINGSAWKGMTYDSSAPKKTGVIHLLR